MSDYPEHDKLKKFIDDGSHETVQEFLDWLMDDNGWLIGEWDEAGRGRLEPVNLSRERIMAKFFVIDLDKIHAEKEQMLSHIRNANLSEAGR